MRFPLPLLLFSLLALALPGHAQQTPARRPNIVVVLIDDMGQTDLGCYGSNFYETPHIDQLAREGARFTQAYSACTVCSPTRASLLTGKSPAALHITDWIAGHKRPFAKLRPPDWCMELPPAEKTLAETLHAAGYATGHFGKWHLGQAPATEHGFDVSIGNNGRGQPARYLSPYENPQLPDGPPGEHLSDRLTAEACQFMEANRERPFFVYLAHYAVHNPLSGKPEVIGKYRAKAQADAPQKNPVYASLVESTDDSVGRLRAKLAELKLTGNTVFVFTSDNGGLVQNTTNLNLRAGKGSAYEGGVRVPLIVYWPGITTAGREITTPAISYDLLPTFLSANFIIPFAGVEGQSLLPVLRGESMPERPLFWHYPHYHPGGATPYSAVRLGEWKLIHFYEDDHRELYHLSADPQEQQDLAAQNPQKATELMTVLDAWRQRVGAQPPLPNAGFDPARQTEGERRPGAGAGKKGKAPAAAE